MVLLRFILPESPMVNPTNVVLQRQPQKRPKADVRKKILRSTRSLLRILLYDLKRVPQPHKKKH